MRTTPAPFIADHVQISTGKSGLRPLAQNGRIRVNDKALQLWDSAGQLLAQTPVSSVTLTPGKGIAAGLTRITIDGEVYSLAIGAGGPMLFTGLLRILAGVRGRRRLAAALAARVTC
jgi:hypothetical protein